MEYGAKVRARQDPGNGPDGHDPALLRKDEGQEGLCHPVGAGDVHRHHQVKLLQLGVCQRAHCGDAGVVDQPVQSPAPLGDGRDRRLDVLRLGHIQPYGLYILDLAQRLEIGILARPGVHEVTVGGEPLGDLATDTGARAGHEDSFLGLQRRSWCLRCDLECDQKDAQRADESLHDNLPAKERHGRPGESGAPGSSNLQSANQLQGNPATHALSLKFGDHRICRHAVRRGVTQE